MKTAAGVIAEAISANFTSPNVSDSNFEPANVVDALDRLASAGFAIARAIERLAEIREEART